MIKKKANKLVVADIFCGAGGLSAGFELARADWDGNRDESFEIAYGVDWDPDAITSFRNYHFPNEIPQILKIIATRKDIKNVTAKSIIDAVGTDRKIDVLIGGPNCQGVSAAGLRNPRDHRNAMLRKFIWLVKTLQPSWFVMENVPGLTHLNNRKLLEAIFKSFEAIEGYKVAGDVLLAADYGVPQLRYRLFIIGTNTGLPVRFPKPTHGPKGSKLFPYITVREAIGDLTKMPPVLYEENDTPNGSNQQVLLNNHFSIRISKVNKKRISNVNQGQDWRDLPIGLLPERFFATRASDQKGAYGRLLGNWPAYTVTNAAYNVTAGPFTHPNRNRALSVREAARLQSFEDRHIFYGNVLSQYRQIGNAVPPLLAKAVAQGILRCHYYPDSVQKENWGNEGRLTLKTIRDAIAGKSAFPVLTPRRVHPRFDRRYSSRPSKSLQISQKAVKPLYSVWETDDRSDGLNSEEIALLRMLAKQPGNYRAAKRAKAIVQFVDKVPKDQIIADAKASEMSLKKWIDGFYNNGLDGWRAYHTPIGKVANGNQVLKEEIQKAIDEVRNIAVSIDIEKSNGNGPKRLYMNNYLMSLIQKYKEMSVTEIIDELTEQLPNGVGTVYVGDLLAIYDTVRQFNPKQY